jgi:two-component system CheB/CheR fusion protein
MAQKVVDLWENASRVSSCPNPPTDLAVDATPTREATNEAERALQAGMHLLRERSGHDFQHYKRATVLRRIEWRMQVSRQPALPADVTYLHASPQETVPLLQDMLISVTNFFRDRPAFDALERLVSEGHFDNRLPAERVPAWVRSARPAKRPIPWRCAAGACKSRRFAVRLAGLCHRH